MPTHIRLDPATARAHEVIARRRGQTVAEVIETAVSELVAREEVTPYERVGDLIGVVSGGPPDLSERAWRPGSLGRMPGLLKHLAPSEPVGVDQMRPGARRQAEGDQRK